MILIDVMFSVSHFQKIGEGIFHFSLIFNIGQVWSFWRHKSVYNSIYNIIDIEENEDLSQFIFAVSKKHSVVNKKSNCLPVQS